MTVGLEKEVAEFRAGLGPAETKAKIILWIIFPTRVIQSHFGHQRKNVAIATFFYFNYNCGTRKGGCQVSSRTGACRNEGKNNLVDYFSDAGCTVPLWAPQKL